MSKWTPCIGAHIAAFGLAFVVGWVWSDAGGPASGQLPTTARGAYAFWSDARAILGINLHALLVLVLANLCTLGVGGLLVHAVNGVRVGALCWMVGQEAPHALPWMWLYLPVEVASFAVGGGAGLVLSLAGVDWLRRSVPMTTVIRLVAVALVCAASGLVVAGLLEAYAIQRAWG